jgi:hypothetical protein
MTPTISEQERYRRAEQRVRQIKGFYWHLYWYLLVNIFLTFGRPIRNLFSEGSMDWDSFNFGSFSVWFFWGIGLGAHWMHVFGKNIIFSRQWEERKIKEFMDRDSFGE